MIPKTLKGYTVYVDGYGYAGKIEEGTPPKVALATEEYSGGGLGGTVDIPMGQLEKLEFDLTMAEINPYVYGLVGHDDVPITFRGAINDGLTTEAVVIETRGLVKVSEIGPWKGRDKGTAKLTCTATYMRVEIGGRETLVVDVVNMIFISLGVDHLAAIRRALGMW